MQTAAEILNGMGSSENISNAVPLEDADIRKLMENRARRYNQEPGNMNADGLYNCERCLNRGYFMVIREQNGVCYEKLSPCKCMKIRGFIWKMKASGLESTIKRCTFDKFDASEEWQQTMLSVAQKYVKSGVDAKKWLYVGGAVGSGKTHLCTAVARELLYSGRSLLYMPWQQEATRLKSLISDSEAYAREIEKVRSINTLYIDDFFKPIEGVPPTAADVKLAYDIINSRYCAYKTTIISSERYISELMEIDEAVASRIYERAKGYTLNIERGNGKNYRLRGADE